jgi:hypothetical protein
MEVRTMGIGGELLGLLELEGFPQNLLGLGIGSGSESGDRELGTGGSGG